MQCPTFEVKTVSAIASTMGMGSAFTRYVGLRCLFIQNRCTGVNAYRHGENTVNYINRDKTLYREQSTFVPLAYSVYDKAEPSSGSPVLIMHGLMGSRVNWNSVAKAINSKIRRKVFAVDARNHGDSAHSPDMTYGHMAEDLRHFVNEHNLGRVSAIGHSMGGRAVMLLALNHPELVEKLVVVDVSPRRVSPSFIIVKNYLKAMQQIKFEDNMSVSAARKIVDKELTAIIKVPAIRQFLAMNVIQADNGKMKWRANLDTIIDAFGEICSFPATERIFKGPTYFIGGGDSDYIRNEDEQEIKRIFPSATIKYIPGAGHWVHADKPNEFVEEVCKFLTGH